MLSKAAIVDRPPRRLEIGVPCMRSPALNRKAGHGEPASSRRKYASSRAAPPRA
jgi:hypothetical protein